MRENRLTLIRYVEHRGHSEYWEAACKCGTVKLVALHNVLSGATSSCGCLRTELAGTHAKTHGMTGSPTYISYRAMLSRCENSRWYTERGIKVCKRWTGKNGFANFVADMGVRPDNGHTIERSNNDGNYCPTNCCWLLKKLQNRNTRNNVMLTFRGKTQCLVAWAEETGINRRTLSNRINKGWSVERALTETAKPGRRRNDDSQLLAGVVS